MSSSHGPHTRGVGLVLGEAALYQVEPRVKHPPLPGTQHTSHCLPWSSRDNGKTDTKACKRQQVLEQRAKAAEALSELRRWGGRDQMT